MIYDCFMFFNELDLLEIRLNELCGTVDKFVILESPETHQGGKKPLHFCKNYMRYAEFDHRIKADVIWHLRGETPMLRQAYQREAALNLLEGCGNNDWIIISDADEIPRADAVMRLKESGRMEPHLLSPTLYYYYLNGLVSENYAMGPVMARYSTVKRAGLTPLRYLKASLPTIKDAGWHFSFLGGPEKIRKKIQAFGYFQLNREEMTNLERIQGVIDQGLDVVGKHEGQHVKYVPLDETFPKYLLENREKFAHLIKEV